MFLTYDAVVAAEAVALRGPLFTFSEFICCGVCTVHDLCVRFMTSVTHSGLSSWDSVSAELWRFNTSSRGWVLVDNTAANGETPGTLVLHVMTSVGLDLWMHGGETVFGDSGERVTC
jgi:hypothetical protein